MPRYSQPRLVFITGTDTGVGKTILTSLLLCHLRQGGCRALAIKPFCSGGRADAELLHALQDGDLSLDEINPFHFKEPLTPLVAARLHRRKIPLSRVTNHVQKILRVLIRHSEESNNPTIQQSISPVLLIEGVGGLLSPLGEPNLPSRITHHASHSYSTLDLFTALAKTSPALRSHILLVTANRLGTLNHTLLSLDKLKQAGILNPILVLNDLLPERSGSLASRYNGGLLSELAQPLRIIRLPQLGKVDSARKVADLVQEVRNSLCKISTFARL